MKKIAFLVFSAATFACSIGGLPPQIDLVALGIGNCPGASFEAIPTPSSSYASTFRLY
jgi:hypothetical protein